MMRYTSGEQAERMGDPARAAHEERRTFARRIDCDSSPRTRAGDAPTRGGSVRERDGWEQPRRDYDR